VSQAENVVPQSGFRLSPQQETAWLLGGSDPAFAARCVIRFDGPIEAARLRAALAECVERHEILRTSFPKAAALRAPSQVVHAGIEPAFDVVDGAASVDAADLSAPPLIRATLVADAGRPLLTLTAPALCADRQSLLELVRELAELYAGRALENEPLQYADYSEWRAELLVAGDDNAKAGNDFWREHPRATVPPLLHGRRSAGPASYDAIELDFTSERDGVARAAEALRTNAGVLLEACLHVVVARLGGTSEVVIESTIDSRVHPELEGALGALTQTAQLATQVSTATTVAEVVDQVQRGRAELERWIDYQPVVVGHRDAYGVGFEYLRHLGATFDGVEASVVELTARTTPIALLLSLHDDDRALRGQLMYDTSVYDADDVRVVRDAYAAALKSVADDPHAAAAAVRILDDEARSRIALESRGSAAEIPATTIHALFERQVSRVPDRVAVTDGSVALTYAELDTAANRLAQRLRGLGIRPDDPVGLCFDRSSEMIAALLGILKAGGAYLPLNFEHPAARLQQQLADAGARVVVTTRKLAGPLGAIASEIVCMDDADETVADVEQTSMGPEHAVYVMYTSGSTGVPKGVAITHRNLVNYTTALLARLELDDAEEGLAFGAISAISTDLGNTAVFPSLLSGGTLHLIPPEASLDGARYGAYVAQHPVDVLKITPSHLKGLLATADVAAVAPRRWLVLGGEASTWELVDSVRAAAGCRILNHYGPTETTVGACTFEITGDGERVSRTVPIGRPLPNVSAYVVDESGEVLPAGAYGELWIGGAGVARGYVGQQQETEKRFVSDHFSSDDGRLYRTGDRVRRLRGGALEFLGRIDDQIKIRGYRVEPGEVEAVLSRYDGVRQAAVLALGDAESGWRLVAYVAASPEPSVAALRAYLGETLPEFMVPAEYAFVDALPLTANGKIDRRALESLATSGGGREYVAPRNPVEQRIASMWAEVLGAERVGVHDDFFDLGGHSLLATQVIARVRAAYDAHVPLHALFAAPTVEGLAAAVKEHRPADADDDADELLAELANLTDEEAAALLAGDGDPERRQ
jgi:amino acid adenylation domain-containing protein